MKRLRDYLTGMLTAFIICALVGTASAKVGKVMQELEYRDISVTLDGQKLDLRNAIGEPVEPFMFGGTNYLPVRALAESLGLHVEWDGRTATVVLTTPESAKILVTPVPTMPSSPVLPDPTEPLPPAEPLSPVEPAEPVEPSPTSAPRHWIFTRETIDPDSKTRNTNSNFRIMKPSTLTPTPSPTPIPEPSGSAGEFQEEVLRLVNEVRADAGLSPLSFSDELLTAAQIRAEELPQSFSHTRPDGSSCFTVFQETGVSYFTAGENIAAGQSTPESVMNSWMNSDGHRANILGERFGKIGIGYVKSSGSSYGSYWCQLFTD